MFLVKYHSTLPPPYPTTHALPLVALDTSGEPSLGPHRGVDVRGLSWPDHDINVVILKPLGYPFGGMLGVIVLLKCSLPSGISNFSKISTTPPSKISQYCTPFMIPWTFQSDPILLILVSSDCKILFQSTTVQLTWYLANLRCSNLCSFLSRGCILLTTSQKSSCLSTFLTVWGVTGSGRMLMMKWVASTALSSLQLVIWWIIDCLLPEDSLEKHPPLLFSLSPSISLLILPMIDFPRPVLDSIWCKGITLLKKGDDGRVFSGRCGFHGVKMERESSWKHVELISMKSHDIIYCSYSWYNGDLACYRKYFAEINCRSKNCPNKWLFCLIYYVISVCPN